MRFAPDFRVWMPSCPHAVIFASQLASLNLAQTAYDDVMAQTWRCFPFLPVPVGQFPPGLTFRARLSDKAIPYSTACEIGMPPAKLLTTFGRANRPYQPIFYTSSSLDAALRETCQVWSATADAVSGFATVGIWQPTGDEPLHLVAMCAAPEPRAQRPEVNDISNFFDEVFEQTLFEFNAEESDARATARVIRMHIADVYARSNIATPNDYKLSAAYTERIICGDSDGVWDGVIYPSVALSFSADNIAIRESTYHRRLTLVAAVFVSYVYLPIDRSVSYLILARGIPVGDGQIHWE